MEPSGAEWSRVGLSELMELPHRTISQGLKTLENGGDCLRRELLRCILADGRKEENGE